MEKTEPDACGQLMQTQSTPKKRIVSSARSTKDDNLKGANFRLPAKQLATLDAIAVDRKVSRSDLIKSAVERCQHDGIWRRGVRKPAPSNKVIVPPAEAVALSNILLEFAFSLEKLLQDGSNQALLDQASRIFLDARDALGRLRKDLGC